MTSPTWRHCAVAAAVASLAMAATAAAATPGTITLRALEPATGPLTVPTTSGGVARGSLGMFRLDVVPQGAPTVTVRGFCDDPLVSIAAGRTYPISLVSASDATDLASPGYHAVGWLLRSAERLIAASAAPNTEAAAIQVAVWKLGGRVPAAATTGNAAVDSRVTALAETARTAVAPLPPTAQATAASACAGSGTVTVTISGAPGATARVQADAAAVVSAPSVVLGADGTGTVTVSATTPSRPTVRVAIDQGTLTRAARVGTTGPQQTVFVMPSTQEVAVPVQFTDCRSGSGNPAGTGDGAGSTSTTTPTPTSAPAPVPHDAVVPAGGAAAAGAPESSAAPTATTLPNGMVDPRASVKPEPAPAPVVPVTPVAQRAVGSVTVVKSAPATARAGARITYRIRVTNTSKVTIRGLTVTDRLPQGLAVPAVPSGATLVGGALRWNPGAMAPGTSLTLTFTAVVSRDHAAGAMCNRAQALVPGAARPTSATACTRVTPNTRRATPAVTA